MTPQLYSLIPQTAYCENIDSQINPCISNEKYIYVMQTIYIVKKANDHSFAPAMGSCASAQLNICAAGHQCSCYRASAQCAAIHLCNCYWAAVQLDSCAAAIGQLCSRIAVQLLLENVTERRLLRVTQRQARGGVQRLSQARWSDDEPG